MVGIEVKGNVAALKAQVDALQTQVDAIDAVTSIWVLDGADGALPTEAAVKTQLAAYDAITVNVSKNANSLNDSLAIVRAAV
jgi:hypothetical protein